MHEQDRILEFWFGAEEADDSTIAGRQSGLWWGKSPEADARIREHFKPQVLAAGAGRLDGWKSRPEGWLALILLLDQFPRNIYRDTPDMYRFDDRARALCIEGLETGIDARLRLIQRVFFYLPLEHAESVEDQAWCVDLMRGLAREAPEDQKPVFEDFIGYAEAHRNIVERFRRFPHRNAILGRESTDEEIEFLKQPGSAF
ncbi:MAG: DUF924 family protein [Wenzhouxiangellaceae bacterium]